MNVYTALSAVCLSVYLLSQSECTQHILETENSNRVIMKLAILGATGQTGEMKKICHKAKTSKIVTTYVHLHPL